VSDVQRWVWQFHNSRLGEDEGENSGSVAQAAARPGGTAKRSGDRQQGGMAIDQSRQGIK
jgi:hypothetical protein